MDTAKSAARIMLYLAIGLFGASFFLQKRLPPKKTVVKEIYNEPVQKRTRKKTFETTVGGITYTIQPQYQYELWGLIVSGHDTGVWWDIYHRDWADSLNVKDLCVIWGDNIEADVYRKMKFKSGSWTCYVSVNAKTEHEDWEKFDMNSLANNHLLADDPEINKLIMKTGVGDQIYFKGYLASYAHEVGEGFERGTSTRRDDRGNGACETVYVTEFKILKSPNRIWRILFSQSKFLILASVVVLVILQLRSPY